MALARVQVETVEALMVPGDPVLSLVDQLARLRPAWMASAACRGMGPEVFFPARGGSTDAARAVCAGCPVAGPCRDYAVADEDLHGLWAGTSKPERRALRRPAS